MDTVEALTVIALTVITTLILKKICYVWKYRSIENVEKALKALDNQEKHEEDLRKKPVKYMQWFFEYLLLILFFICLAQVSSYVFIWVESRDPLTIFGGILPAILWGGGAIFSILGSMKGESVRFPERAKLRAEEKRKKLNKKLNQLKNHHSITTPTQEPA